jgi:hypothetical protein
MTEAPEPTKVPRSWQQFLLRNVAGSSAGGGAADAGAPAAPYGSANGFLTQTRFSRLKVLACSWRAGEGGQLSQCERLQLWALVAVQRGGAGVSCRAASRYLRTVNAIRLMLAPVMLPFTLMSNDTV